MSIGYFYMLGCKNPLCNQLSLQSQRLNLWFLTSSMNYRHVLLDWCLISLTMYQYLENSLWVQALVYSWLRMSLPTCCLCWGISASLGYLSFKSSVLSFMSWIGYNNVFLFSVKSLLFQPLPIFHSRKFSTWKEEKETCLTASLVSLCLENCMSVATKKWISLVLFWWFLSLDAVVADLDLTGYWLSLLQV